MGLFDRFKPKTQTGLSLEESIAALMLGAVAVDGDVSSQELQSCNVVCSRMPLFRDMSQNNLERVFKRVGELLESSETEKTLLSAAGAVPDELKLPVFANAVDIVFADGDVGEEEQDYIAFLAEHLGVDDEQATAVIEVLRIKNFG
jgi:uncharacterized tellurite resistance protein B-like protein